MNGTAETALRLVRAGLDGMAATDIQVEDWAELRRFSAKQGILALVWDGITVLPADAKPPVPEMLLWAANADRIEMQYDRQRAALGRLAGFYRKHGIDMLLLKGYGLSLYYPKPEHRPCGDIDIWLYGRQKEADRAIETERNITVDYQTQHHTVFQFDGIRVENHFDFLNLEVRPSNRKIEPILRRLSNLDGGTVRIEGTDVRLPAPNFNALFLLRHMVSHFPTAELVLRHLCDWSLFLEKDGREVDWTELLGTAEKYNMHRFLAAVNRICCEWFGLPAECCGGIIGNDEKLARRIIDDIIEPEFDRQMPDGNTFAKSLFRLRRWWSSRWKHRIVYSDSLAATFIRAVGKSLSGR